MDRNMKNKFKTTIKVLGILTACFMMASFSPSLDGRAVVVDQGVFPQGLFAKTVGYLPGDIISVANITGDSTVDLLVIGALDPSDGIAIMLSPEAAAAVGISKDDNSIVKITKRNGQNERVYGTAVIAKQSVTPETSALEIDIAEEDFDETEEDAFSEDAFEEDILADDSTAADEEAALPEEENPIPPEEEEENFEEESVAEEDTAEESDEEASDFETIAATESEPVEENEETEDEDIPYDEQFEEEPLPEETEEAEEAVPEEAVAEAEMEAEAEPEPVAEPIAEETEPEEEIAEPAVEAEPESETEAAAAEEPVSEAEPAEEKEKIEEELVTEYVPAEKWEVVIPDEVWAEEEYAERPASPTEDSEIPADTPYEEEDLLGMYTNPAISRYEDAMSDDYEEDGDEEDDDEVEATDDYDEYAAIVLVPVNPEPSPAPAYQPEADAEAEAEPETPAPAIVPSPAVDESESYEITDNNYSKYMVDGLSDLKSGSYYIQIATLSIDENIMEIVNKYSANYPITIVPLSSGARKQVLIGPLSMDEYAVVLERFKAYGYKDAFLRKIK